MNNPTQHVVVMTGATGGFGAYALRHLAAQPNTRVIIGVRASGRKVPTEVEIIPLDLASLGSVRDFANSLVIKLGETRVDTLILNAGIHLRDSSRRSFEGYELTFAVNHLAHYLLIRLLRPHLAENGRVIITSSNMHNPPFKRAAPMDVAPLALAHPSETGPGTGMRAYCASKLCNLLTAQSVADLSDIRKRKISVIAFNPGLTGGSSGRDNSWIARALVRILMHTVFRIIGLFRPEFTMNSPAHSGAILADVALGKIAPPPGKLYISLVNGQPTFPAPSALARDKDAQERLWRASADMVGLK